MTQQKSPQEVASEMQKIRERNTLTVDGNEESWNNYALYAIQDRAALLALVDAQSQEIARLKADNEVLFARVETFKLVAKEYEKTVAARREERLRENV